MPLQFPTTPVLDNFNRADENPLSQSGAWTSCAEIGGDIKLVSNQILSNIAYACSYRGSFTNAEAYVQLGTIAASSNDYMLNLRFKDNGGASPIRDSRRDGYQALFDGKANWRIDRMDNGTNTALTALTAWAGGALSDGDWVGFRANGSTLEIWAKRGAGAWLLETSVTDTTYTAAGAISMQSQSLTSTFDNFGGGEYPADSTVTIRSPQLDFDYSR